MIRFAQTTVQFRADSGGAEVAIILLWLVFVVAYVVAVVRIITRAGYSGWWVLVAFVPLLNIVMFLVFAFSRWPIQRELEALRGSAPGGGTTPGGPASVVAPPPPPPPPLAPTTETQPSSPVSPPAPSDPSRQGSSELTQPELPPGSSQTPGLQGPE